MLAFAESAEPVRRRHCSGCDGRYNCDGSNAHYREVVAGEIFDRCPNAIWKDPLIYRAFKHYGRYAQRGLLPRVGGTGAQDARLMAAFDLIDREHGRIRREESKRGNHHERGRRLRNPGG